MLNPSTITATSTSVRTTTITTVRIDRLGIIKQLRENARMMGTEVPNLSEAKDLADMIVALALPHVRINVDMTEPHV